MAAVDRDGNAPLEGRARHAQILQSRQQEIVDHLFFARLRLDETGIVLYIFKQAVGIGAHTEFISFFLCFYHRTAAVGTDGDAFFLFDLRVGIKRLVGLAIPAFVGALVYIALLVEFFKYRLNRFFVTTIRRADEFCIACADKIKSAAYFALRYLVHKFFGRYAGFGGFILDLLTMLVGAG